jgi:hypothetical protein
MNRQDIEKLLGGYATGSLTPDEEQALFAAALEDQELFDALMAEQPLRDLLREPTARATLLAALSDRPAPWYHRFSRPLIAVAALLLIGAPVAIWRTSQRPAQVVLTAQMDKSPKGGSPVVEMQPLNPPPNLPHAVEVRREAAATRQKAATKAEPAEEPFAAPKSAAPDQPAAPQPAGITAPSKDTRADALVINGAEAQQLKAASATETVEVTAQDVQGQQVKPVSGFLPSPEMARVKASPVFALADRQSPVNTTVLRRNQEGAFVAADPNDLHAGDTVKLRLESASTGFVYIWEQKKLLAQSSIEAGKPFETILDAQGAGRRQLQIRFSPRQVVWNAAAPGGVAGGTLIDGKPATDGPLLPSPAITLTLQYK